eukprot:TRINITY_DN1135_c0_g1_i6.p1 TRINITY_DN1135_c0_g1~~TRINITY_DN1135_c0_g1_i6.p1  ORF type:complete len:2894 (+),score=752.90 TRINITY_DN1135_c0_g1_i6:116-8797(+)
MLEKIATLAITHLVGQYVENIDSQKLKVSLRRGEAEIRDLVIRENALEGRNFPVSFYVQHGTIGRIFIEIPWTRIKSQSMKVYVDDVNLLLRSKDRRDLTPEEVQDAENAEKLRKLEATEQLDNMSDEESGFFAHMGDVVWKNLQVYVKNVHVRYEGYSYVTKERYAVGAMIPGMHSFTVDSEWNQTFISAAYEGHRKMAEVQGFMAYVSPHLDEDDMLENDSSRESVIRRLKNMIPRDVQSSNLEFIVRPLHFQAKAAFLPGLLDIFPMLEKLDLECSQRQYQLILEILDQIIRASHALSNPVKRPISSPTDDPRAWWQYAIASVSSRIGRTYVPFNWDTLVKRKQMRREYIGLYKRKDFLRQKWMKKLSEKDISQLLNLEMEIPYDDIVLYRVLARREVEAEIQKRGAKQKKSVFSFFSSSAEKDDMTLWDLSEAERQELYRSMDYYAITEEMEAKRTKENRVKFDLDALNIRLRSLDDEFRCVLGKTSMSLGLHPDATNVSCDTSAFSLNVAPVGAAAGDIKKSIIDLHGIDENCFSLSFSSTKASVPSFSLKTGKPEANFDRVLLQRLVAFFIPSIYLNLEFLASSVGQIVENTEKQIAEAFQNANKMNIDVELRAPIIHLPCDRTDTRGPEVLIELGTALVKSAEMPEDICIVDQDKVKYDTTEIVLKDTRVFVLDSPTSERVPVTNSFGGRILLTSLLKPRLFRDLPLLVSRGLVGELEISVSPAQFGRVMASGDDFMRFAMNPTGSFSVDAVELEDRCDFSIKGVDEIPNSYCVLRGNKIFVYPPSSSHALDEDTPSKVIYLSDSCRVQKVVQGQTSNLLISIPSSMSGQALTQSPVVQVSLSFRSAQKMNSWFEAVQIRTFSLVGIRSPAMKHIEDVVSMVHKDSNGEQNLIKIADVEGVGSVNPIELPQDVPSKRKKSIQRTLGICESLVYEGLSITLLNDELMPITKCSISEVTLKSHHTAFDHSLQISLGSLEWFDCQNKIEGVYPYIISGRGDGSESGFIELKINLTLKGSKNRNPKATLCVETEANALHCYFQPFFILENLRVFNSFVHVTQKHLRSSLALYALPDKSKSVGKKSKKKHIPAYYFGAQYHEFSVHLVASETPFISASSTNFSIEVDEAEEGLRMNGALGEVKVKYDFNSEMNQPHRTILQSMTSGVPGYTIQFISKGSGGSKVRLGIEGSQVVFLREHMDHFLEYIDSEVIEDVISLATSLGQVASIKKTVPKDGEKSKLEPRLSYSIGIKDSVIIIPERIVSSSAMRVVVQSMEVGNEENLPELMFNVETKNALIMFGDESTSESIEGIGVRLSTKSSVIDGLKAYDTALEIDPVKGSLHRDSAAQLCSVVMNNVLKTTKGLGGFVPAPSASKWSVSIDAPEIDLKLISEFQGQEISVGTLQMSRTQCTGEGISHDGLIMWKCGTEGVKMISGFYEEMDQPLFVMHRDGGAVDGGRPLELMWKASKEETHLSLSARKSSIYIILESWLMFSGFAKDVMMAIDDDENAPQIPSSKMNIHIAESSIIVIPHLIQQQNRMAMYLFASDIILSRNVNNIDEHDDGSLQLHRIVVGIGRESMANAGYQIEPCNAIIKWRKDGCSMEGEEASRIEEFVVDSSVTRIAAHLSFTNISFLKECVNYYKDCMRVYGDGEGGEAKKVTEVSPSLRVDDVQADEPKSNVAGAKKDIRVVFRSDISNVLLEVVDDFESVHVPLMRVTMKLDHVEGMFGKQKINVRCMMDMNIYHFASDRCGWEPLLERASVSCLFDTKPGRIRQEANLSVECLGPLLLNVTHSMIVTTAKVNEQWDHADVNQRILDERSEEVFYPFELHNLTSNDLVVSSPSLKEFTVSGGNSVPFSFADKSSKIRKWESAGDFDRLYVRTSAQANTVCIPLSIGVYPLRMPGVEKPFTCFVSFEKGIRSITLSSWLSFENKTLDTIEVLGQKDDEVTVFASIEHGARVYRAPVSFVEQDAFSVRPNLGQKEDASDLSMYPFAVLDRTFIQASHFHMHAANEGLVQRHYIVRSLGLRVNQQVRCVIIQPPFEIRNLLPVDCYFAFSYDKNGEECAWESVLSPGHHESLSMVDPMKAVYLILRPVGAYGASKPTLIHRSLRDGPGDFPSQINIYDTYERCPPLILSLDIRLVDGVSRHIEVFSEHWIVNNSLVPLAIKRAYGDGELYTGQSWLQGTHEETRGATPLVDVPLMIGKTIDEDTSVLISARGFASKKPIPMKLGGMKGEVVLKSQDGGRDSLHVGISVEKASIPFDRTTVLTIKPRFVLINDSSHVLQFRQLIESGVHRPRMEILPGYSQPVHFETKSTWLQIRVSQGDTFTRWSNALPQWLPGEHELMVDDNVWLTLKWKTDVCQVVMCIYDGEAKNGFVLKNDLSTSVAIHQRGVPVFRKVMPRSSIPFAWDSLAHERLIEVLLEDRKITISPDDLGETDRHKVGDLIFFTRKSVIDEIRTVVVTMDVEMEDEEEMETSFGVHVIVPTVGVSLIDDTPQEIIYAQLDGSVFHYSRTDRNAFLECVIADAQIDNCLVKAENDVVLRKRRSSRNRGQDFLRFSLSRELGDFGFIFINYASIKLAELEIFLDNGSIDRIAEAANALTVETSPEKSSWPAEWEMKHIDTSSWNEKAKKFVYFKMLHLNSIRTLVTYKLVLSQKLQHTRNPIEKFIRKVGFTVMNVSDAPLKFNVLLLENVFETSQGILDLLKARYESDAKHQVVKLIGSADMIGNPVGLFRGLGTGVMDFFQEPAQGIVKGPKEFATGVRRGTHSMVKNTLSSALGTAQSLATGIRKVADVASMDEDEARRDEAARRRKPKNAVDGVAEGGKRLVEGIAGGATGIITKPIEGAKKGGALGFFRGVARGVVGYSDDPSFLSIVVSQSRRWVIHLMHFV